MKVIEEGNLLFPYSKPAYFFWDVRSNVESGGSYEKRGGGGGGGGGGVGGDAAAAADDDGCFWIHSVHNEYKNIYINGGHEKDAGYCVFWY